LQEETSLRLAFNSKKVAALEKVYGCTLGKKASKGEPHERIWDGISPVGHGGSKTSRGRETLGA
jgi:hypothetical protein